MSAVNSKKREHIADFLLFTVTLFWGSTFIIVKESIAIMPVFAFLGIRFFIASIILFFVVIFRLRRINLELIKNGVFLGIVLFLSYAFQTVALLHTKATVVGFLTGLNVVIVPVLAAIFFSRRPAVSSAAGVLFAATGIFMLSSNGSFLLETGDILGILCAVFISIHILLTDRYSKMYDIYLLTFVEIFTVAVFSTLTSMIFEPQFIPKKFDNFLLFSFLITSVFATAYAFVIQTTAQKYTTPTKAALIFTAEPVTAAFFGYFMGGEVLTMRGYIGAFLIFTGIIVAEFSPAILRKFKHAQNKISNLENM
ncbi:MAG: membrane protein [bacterium]|nr:MAG: membrane protein [bacterium]